MYIILFIAEKYIYNELSSILLNMKIKLNV
jgi:hypothetical protein